MHICELHQRFPGQHFPGCKCNIEHEGAVICDFHKKYPTQWLAACDCGREEKKLRLKGHIFKGEKAESVQCEGTTKAGNRCKRRPLAGSKFCKAHQPEQKG